MALGTILTSRWWSWRSERLRSIRHGFDSKVSGSHGADSCKGAAQDSNELRTLAATWRKVQDPQYRGNCDGDVTSHDRQQASY
jgi:hypothetical protein